jgi:hypothetical protein
MDGYYRVPCIWAIAESNDGRLAVASWPLEWFVGCLSCSLSVVMEGMHVRRVKVQGSSRRD